MATIPIIEWKMSGWKNDRGERDARDLDFDLNKPALAKRADFGQSTEGRPEM